MHLPPVLGLSVAAIAAFPVFSVVEGVPDHLARQALDLLEQAPTLNAAELSDYLGMTRAQGWACVCAAGQGW